MKFFATLLFTLSLLFTHFSSAVGLGQATLFSSLGQPLKVNITIVDAGRLTADDFKVIQVRPKSKAGQGTLNQDIPYRFKIVRDENQQLIIQARSRGNINEPYVSFLLSLEMPNGVVSREYTLMLDL